MNKKISLIIFDLDGTLMDAYKPVEKSVNYTMRRMGLAPIATGTIKRTVGWGDRHLIETFVGREKADRALAIYRKHHKTALRKGTKLLPGARQVLRRLHQEGYALAVASNRPTFYTRMALAHLGIKGLFDCVLCGDRVKRPKPAADILLAILRKFSLGAAQALYVGDMHIDVQAGRRARIKTVAVTTGSSSARQLRRWKPYRIIRNVGGLFPVLRQLNRDFR